VSCRRIRSLLSAYIDGELTGYDMLAVREHIATCCDCQEERESLLTVKRLLGSMCDPVPDPTFVRQLASHRPVAEPEWLVDLYNVTSTIFAPVRGALRSLGETTPVSGFHGMRTAATSAVVLAGAGAFLVLAPLYKPGVAGQQPLESSVFGGGRSGRIEAQIPAQFKYNPANVQLMVVPLSMNGQVAIPPTPDVARHIFLAPPQPVVAKFETDANAEMPQVAPYYGPPSSMIEYTSDRSNSPDFGH